MTTGYVTLFDSSGNGLGIASAATNIDLGSRYISTSTSPLTVGTGNTSLSLIVGSGGTVYTKACIGGGLSCTTTNAYGLLLQTTFTWDGAATPVSSALFLNPSYSGTFTTVYGAYLQSGSGGTIGTAYSLYCANPASGTTKVCAYFEGNVGIGKTSPTELLHLESTVRNAVIGIQTTGETNLMRLFKIAAGSRGDWTVNLDTDGVNWQRDDIASTGVGIALRSDGIIGFRGVAAGANPAILTEAFLFDAINGRMAIGGVAPSTNWRLYVDGRIHIGDSFDSTAYGQIQITRTVANGTGFHQSFIRNGNAVFGFGFLSSSNTFGMQHGLDNTGSTGIFVDNTGLVGVGYRTPDHRLTVNGAALGASANDVSSIASFRQTDGSNNSILMVQSFRRSAGTGHATEETRIRRRIDVTDMGFFGLGSNYAKISGNGGDGIWVSSGENLCIGSLSAVANNKLEVAAGGMRIQGANSNTATGVGLELEYLGSNAYMRAYNRATGVFTPVYIDGSAFSATSRTAGVTLLCESSAAIAFWTSNQLRSQITSAGHFTPASESLTCGASGARWASVWAVNGTIQTSDETQKDSIRDTDLGLNFVSRLRPVNYRLRPSRTTQTRRVPVDPSKPAGSLDQTFTEITEEVIINHSRCHEGLLAQEVGRVLTDMGLSGDDFGGYIDPAVNNDTGPLGLRYDEFIGPIIKSVQEVNQRLVHQESRSVPVEGAPLSSTAPGEPGQVRYTDSHVYVCVAQNKWGRCALEFAF